MKMDGMKKAYYFVIFINLIVPLLHSSHVSSQTDIISELGKAEANVLLGYDAIVLAEKNGANVKTLVNELNKAIDLYAEARYYYAQGDFFKTIARVNVCIDVCRVVQIDAQTIYFEAIQDSENYQYNEVVYAILLMLLIIIFYVIAWLVFKRYYLKQLFNMKPLFNED